MSTHPATSGPSPIPETAHNANIDIGNPRLEDHQCQNSIVPKTSLLWNPNVGYSTSHHRRACRSKGSLQKTCYDNGLDVF